jgi:glycosyltransferase involved in cell wall biosynthesis
MKHKKVIWRSIGQSSPNVESALFVPHSQGMKIVRYSPAEEGIRGYIGKDATIRFYKDPEEFKDYNGEIQRVVTMAQNMKTPRSASCNFNAFEASTAGMNRIIYGPGNEDTGMDGGRLSYDDLKKAYRDNRVYFYTGTYPASYTLNFIEAMMSGIPIVSIGKTLANIDPVAGIDTFEIDSIIQNGKNGFISNEIAELREYVSLLLNDHVLAKKIGEAGRQTAIELFGKETIKQQWEEFLNHYEI